MSAPERHSECMAIEEIREPLTVTQRLQHERRWAGQAEAERDEMMKLAKDRFSTKEERQSWVYSELDRMYPPHVPPKTTMSPGSPKDDNVVLSVLTNTTVSPDTGQIQGLGDLPDDWPKLPANASLAAEIAWVQANRLRIVREIMGAATRARLDRALSPAPSWAALGWLETSIRSYAKFVDVAAKATSVDDGEAAVMKRERVALDEVRRLLAEMREAAKAQSDQHDRDG